MGAPPPPAPPMPVGGSSPSKSGGGGGGMGSLAEALAKKSGALKHVDNAVSTALPKGVSAGYVTLQLYFKGKAYNPNVLPHRSLLKYL